jgi:KDO2-lipid IV(A) lauroyltransferase
MILFTAMISPENLLQNQPETLLTKRWYHFLAPRFWGTWLILGLLRLLICLPYPLLLKVGRGLGHLIRIILKKRTHITAVNLKLCFPALSETEREALLQKNFASVGIGILEAALAWWASDARLRKMVTYHGFENLEALRKQNKGVLLVACHVTGIELGLRMLSFKTPISVLYLPQTNLLFEWVLLRARRRYIEKSIIQSDMYGLLRRLKQGHVVCYTPDQDKGPNSSVFALFFGITAASVKATGKILSHSQASAISALYIRDEVHQKYNLTLSPPMENFPTGDDIQDATRMNKVVEDLIRQAPEQYLWQHRRFKTRPPEEPSLY